MNKNYNKVECSWCNHRDESWRRKNICANCNNTKLVPDPKEILCNLCGETTRPLGTFGEQSKFGLEDVAIVGSYDSRYLFDLRRYTFTLCEKCLRNIFNQCKIPPYVEDVDLDGKSYYDAPISYEDDRRSNEYRFWKESGGHHQAYLDKKCNFAKECPNKAIYTVLYSDQDFSENACCEEHKSAYGHNAKHYKFVKFISNNLKIFL